MIRTVPLAMAALAAAGAALAADPASHPAASAAPAPPRVQVFLTPADIDPARLLPPPPIDASPQTAAELAELHRLTAGADAGRWAQAKWDNDNEDGTIFQSAVAPGFDLKALPATAKLLDEVRNEEAIAASKAKDYFKRDRPWIVDPTLKTCSRDEKPQSSYPSGHTTMAYAMAVVLAEAMPDVAQGLMNRARDYADSRLICGMHYRADIVGGQALGTLVAVQLLHNARFREDLAAAHAELVSAHLTAGP